jgi:predicted ATPase
VAVGDALLEREPQLAALADLLNGVRASSAGRLVLVGGEAWVGKTTLLRRFCRDTAGAAGVMCGSCAPLRTPRPLAELGVEDAVASVLRHMTTLARQADAARRHWPAKAPVCPASPRRAAWVLGLDTVRSPGYWTRTAAATTAAFSYRLTTQWLVADELADAIRRGVSANGTVVGSAAAVDVRIQCA